MVSARLASAAWTITATVARSGINPLTYLSAYFGACAEGGGKAPGGAELARFFPWGASASDLAAWRGSPGGPGTSAGPEP